MLTFLIILLVLILIGYLSGNQPKHNAVAAVEQQFAIPLEKKRINVGEINLNVIFAGPKDGKPILLLHGYPEFWYAWRGVIPVLVDAGFRVIVPDQRGYNESDKPPGASAYTLDKLAGDIDGLIDALGYTNVFLAGHDFGGLVLWWTLLLYPNRVENFVIINKPHPSALRQEQDQGETISWYRTFLRIPWLPGYVARLGNWFLLVKNLIATSRPGTFAGSDLEQYRSAWNNDGAIHSMGTWYRANAKFDMHKDANIKAPGLYLRSANDAFSSQQSAKKSMDFVDNTSLVELDSGTHWIIQESPELVGEYLIRHFNNSQK